MPSCSKRAEWMLRAALDAAPIHRELTVRDLSVDRLDRELPIHDMPSSEAGSDHARIHGDGSPARHWKITDSSSRDDAVAEIVRASGG